MIRQSFAIIMLACASFNATARDELNEAQITERIQEKVSHFAQAVTCVDAAKPDPVLRPDFIGALQPYQLDTMDGAEFVGFWVGDMGCTGGTGTVKFNLVNVKTDEKGVFYVDARASEPAIKIDGINARFVQRVVGASLDTMTIEGLDFEAGDANDFPTRTYRYTLKRDSAGDWKVAARKDLNSAKK